MKEHAWIDYEIFGRRYRYTGALPKEDDIDEAIGEALDKMHEQGIPGGIENLLRAAGATIIEVHSIRPDGSIHWQDFPDAEIH